MKKVLITGSAGVIGRVLNAGLRGGYELTLADIPDSDIRDYRICLKLLDGKDAVVHLAWNTQKENWQSPIIDPENTLMFENIYRAALEKKVRRVIMASSVHVEKYKTWNRDKYGLISPNRDAWPDSPYGAHKILMEKTGMIYADNGLEVVCIRFGGVCPLGEFWDDIPVVGLSYPDCVNLVKSCLEAKIPDNFLTIYGISNNALKIHDCLNPLGWKPSLDAEKFYKKFIRAT